MSTNDTRTTTTTTTTPTTTTTTFTEMALMSKSEAESLLLVRKENETLKLRLNELLQESTESHIRIIQKDLEIEILKRENADLKLQITELEKKVNFLTSDAIILHSRLEILELEREYNKFLIPLKDLNKLCQIEQDNGLSFAFRKKMNKLRKFRVESFHYIDDDDEVEVQDYKKFSTISNLNSKMSPACRLKFQKLYGVDFLQIFANYFKNLAHPAPISPEEQSEADDWWN